MKKYFCILCNVLLLLVACTPTTNGSYSNLKKNNQELIHNYYSKDVSDSFQNFLANLEENNVLNRTMQVENL